MTSEVPSDAAFALLKSKTRRQVTTLLLEAEGTWDIEELAGELVRLDPTVAPDGADVDAHTERLAIRLYHCSIPKLADADVVDFDREAMTVAPDCRLSVLGSYLDESLGLPNAVGECVESTASV